MRHTTILRILVAAELVLLGWALLPAAYAWIAFARESTGPFAVEQPWLFSYSIVILLLAILANVGLLLLKRWSRSLYLVAVVGGLIASPFMSSVARTWSEDAMSTVASMLSGAIIAGLYLGPFDAVLTKPAKRIRVATVA
jgi:hypothetical protein